MLHVLHDKPEIPKDSEPLSNVRCNTDATRQYLRLFFFPTAELSIVHLKSRQLSSIPLQAFGLSIARKAKSWASTAARQMETLSRAR
jgi:hypothetical protein